MPRNKKNRRVTQRPSMLRRLLPWWGLIALIFCVGLVIGHFRTRDTGPVAPVAKDVPQPLTRDVILYFAALDGRTLVAESRAIADCQVEEDCLRDTVRALIAGPQGDLSPILPKQVALHSVTISDSLVTVDFSRELVTGHPGGTQSELLTVYGLADSLVANFPYLRQVQILIDGAPRDTLKGHVDLRQPLFADFSLVEEGLAPAGKIGNVPTGGDE